MKSKAKWLNMDSEEPRFLIFVVAAFLFQAGALLKLALCLKARRGQRLQVHRRLKELWSWCKQEKLMRLHELDEMRSRWLRRVWLGIAITTQLRLLVRQWRIWQNGEQVHTYDLSTLPYAFFGLLFSFFPRLISPQSQDAWYIIMALVTNTFLRIVWQGDLNQMIHLTVSARFVFGVLARRTSWVILVLFVNIVLDVLASPGASPGASSGYSYLLFDFELTLAGGALTLAGVLGVRMLLQENALLKAELQGRMVELGAVSSLLTVCHDAVVEVDECLRLTNDSPQISFMRLNAPGVKNLKGSAFVDLFCDEDKEYIEEQLEKALASNGAAAGVFTTCLVDADQNKVRTELFYSLFQSLDQRKSFLIALREVQDQTFEDSFEDQVDRLEGEAQILAALDGSPLVVPSDHELFIMFRMDSFDVVALSPLMKMCCSDRLGGQAPVNILDIAGDGGRLLLCQRLQVLGNRFANSQVEEPQPMSFDLLGVQVSGWVSFEHDEALDGYVGSLVVSSEALGQLARRRHRRSPRSRLGTGSSTSSRSGSIQGLRKTAL